MYCALLYESGYVHNENILHKYLWYWLKIQIYDIVWVFSWNISRKTINCQISGWFSNNIYMNKQIPKELSSDIICKFEIIYVILYNIYHYIAGNKV